MPSKLIIFLTLCTLSLSLSHGGSGKTRQRHHLHGRCDIKRLVAAVPSFTIKEEAGVIEIWDNRTPEFLCTGVAATVVTMSSGGLLVPVFNNAPSLSIVLQGRGVLGTVIPGCSDTVQSEYKSSKLFRITEGDVIASPTDAVQWIYNDDFGDIFIVTFNYRLNEVLVISAEVESFSTTGGNLLSGLDADVLEEALGTEAETVSQIQAKTGNKSVIVAAPDLNLQIPNDSVKGVGESLCNLKLAGNLNNSSQSEDIGLGSVGRSFVVNVDFGFGVSGSAAHVVLYKNAILGPQWIVNAHIAMYITKGDGMFSVANDKGKAVFDDKIERGQILVIPRGYRMVVKAGEGGLEWVEIRTNDNVVKSQIVGKNSVLGGIPVNVVAKAFNISAEQAEKLR